MKKSLYLLFAVLLIVLTIGLTGCNEVSPETQRQLDVSAKLEKSQPTPTDVDYSLERYNLIKRAYWVNGQREKALALECGIQKPLGYIVLLTDNGAVVSKFIVDGKVSSLNSYLTPESEFYEKNGGTAGSGTYVNKWLADVDGSYGVNDNGIFFFTPNGNYIEWTGTYLYSDIPFEITDPVIKMQEVSK